VPVWREKGEDPGKPGSLFDQAGNTGSIGHKGWLYARWLLAAARSSANETRDPLLIYDVRCGPMVVADDDGLSDVIKSKLYQPAAAVIAIMRAENKSRLPI
jgi:hypothetical protein